MKKQEHQLLITVKDLTWWYDGVPLFKKFNFSLYENDFAVIMWPSWSGKSTLSKLITGHITPPVKTIYHKMEDLSKFSTAELQQFRRNLGMVFQKDYFIKALSIKENILYPLQMLGVSVDEAMQKYREVLRYLDIKHLQDKKVSDLSVGEVQKVFIARALIHSPEFILIDDAISSLDKKSKEQILDVLLKYHTDGYTILLITHDEDMVNYLNKYTKIAITTV